LSPIGTVTGLQLGSLPVMTPLAMSRGQRLRAMTESVRTRLQGGLPSEPGIARKLTEGGAWPMLSGAGRLAVGALALASLLPLAGCSGPSQSPTVEQVALPSSSESESGSAAPPADDVASPDQPTTGVSGQPSESASLAALSQRMLSPDDLQGQWKLALDEWEGRPLDAGDAGGPVAGFYCAEGWPDLDEIASSQPPWQTYTQLTLDDGEASSGGSEEDLPAVSESVATGQPAEMRRAFRVLRKLLGRCLEHNSPDSGEDATYRAMPAPNVGLDSFGFEVLGPVGDKHYTAVVLTGPALVKVDQVHLLTEGEADSVGLGKADFLEVVATAVAKLEQ
jgi:hypothetical protein